ncbi:MAG TPA: ABC transporter permease, partial [Armatimonadota bacterium]|nr:ABC transporter permease [Armatimonadota bacterium]
YVNEQVFRDVAADPAVARATRFLMRAVPDRDYSRVRVFMGVDEAFFPMKPWITLQQGRWFSSPTAEEAIIGYGAAERLRLSLGQSITALPGTPPVRVVGILDRCGGQDDGTLFLPLYRAQRLFDKREQLSGVGVKLVSLDRLEPFAARINELPAVQVISLPQVQTTIFRLLRTGRVFALGTAAVAVLVALISVSNAVLLSVVQRSRTIATMRALGASTLDVFTLTVTEAVLLCLLGGFAGSLLAALLGRGVSDLLAGLLPFAEPGATVIRASSVAVAIAGTALLGVFAGAYPGWRAGCIAPAAAMRE